MNVKKLISGVLAASMAVSLSACGGGGGGSSYDGPTIDQLTVGKDYTDLTAEI